MNQLVTRKGNLSLKELKIFCIALGGFYAFFGFLSLNILKMQMNIISGFEVPPDDYFMGTFKMLYKVWTVFMPLLTILGIVYVVWGLLFHKTIKWNFVISLIMSVLSLVWVLAYSINLFGYLDLFVAGIGDDFPVFTYTAYGFSVFGFIMLFLLFTFPQYMLRKNIKYV